MKFTSKGSPSPITENRYVCCKALVCFAVLAVPYHLPRLFLRKSPHLYDSVHLPSNLNFLHSELSMPIRAALRFWVRRQALAGRTGYSLVRGKWRIVLHLEHQKSFPAESSRNLSAKANPISKGGVATA